MSEQIIEIAIEQLHESPFNPRKDFNQDALQELANNIKAEGRILQPLLVRPRVPELFRTVEDERAECGKEIVFGHRRYRAAVLAGLSSVPCMVRTMTDEEVKRAQISENLQRADVTPLEEAQSFRVLIDEHNETADRIAEQLGKSRSYVYGRLKLLDLHPEVRRACAAGDVDAEVALLIARLRHPKLQEKALSYIKGRYIDLQDGGKKSYRAVKDLLNEHFTLDLTKAPFPIEEEMLVPAAGNCVRCRKRSGNAPEYADVVVDKNEPYRHRKVGPDVCTDPDCFGQKKVAFFKRQADDLRAKGKQVIDGSKARAAVDAFGRLKGDYVALKEVRSEVAEARRVAQRDPKIPPPLIVTIQDPRTGKTVEAVRGADLKTAGVERKEEPKRSNSHDWQAEQRRAEEQAKAETERRTALFHRVRDAIRGRERSADEARIVAAVVLDHLLDSDDAERLAALWSVPTDRPGPGEPSHWQATIARMSPADVAFLLLDCVMVLETTVGRWDLESIPAGLYAVAQLHGMPLDGSDTPSTAARAATGASKGKALAKTAAGGGAAEGAARGQAVEGKEQTDDAGYAGGSDANTGGPIDAMEAA